MTRSSLSFPPAGAPLALRDRLSQPEAQPC